MLKLLGGWTAARCFMFGADAESLALLIDALLTP
jgi:hypothetical protein